MTRPTPLQIEVLRRVEAGLTDAEIDLKRRVRTRDVRRELGAAGRMLGARDRAQAARGARLFE